MSTRSAASCTCPIQQKQRKKCKNDIVNASDATRVILNSEPTM